MAVSSEEKSSTRKKLYADVDAILSNIESRYEATKERRSLTEETISELKKSGYFRVLQPRKYQGLELDPQDFCRLDMKISEQCMSTGWVCGVIGVHPFQLALMPEQAQEEVWADDPDTLVSSSYAPMAKVEPTDNGFKFSGRWSWSSGCDHVEWALLGGIIPEEGYRTFLIPKSDFEIIDTWHVTGLQGTGSKDVVVEETFVPDYRTHKQLDGFSLANPGGHDAPMYQIPWGQIFVRAVNTATIGALKKMLSLFVGASGGSSSDVTKLGNDPHVQTVVAKASETIASLEAVLYHNFEEMMACVEKGEEIPMLSRIRSRYQASLVVDRCLGAARALYENAGGRAVFLDSVLRQWFLDINVSRAHIANNPTAFARNYGAVLMGQENTDFFL